MSLGGLRHELAHRVRNSALFEWSGRQLASGRGARIVQPQGRLQPGEGPFTLVVVCNRAFDQRVPNAVTSYRMGWCHAFEDLGVPYRLLAARDLARELPALPNPVCWLSGYDYADLDDSALRCLARVPHAVLVNPAFDGDEAHYRRTGVPSLAFTARQRRRMLSSQPRLLFTIAAPSRFAFFERWREAGVPLVSLPLACDTRVYGGAGDEPAAATAGMVFVGGYWAYKARQFERYLRPYASRLTVYGYSRWPYGRYGGLLPREREAALYRGARLCPVINEPHVGSMGIDVNERVFKVLGSGGLALTDATPAYREWFTPAELLVPGTLAEYHELAHMILSSTEDFEERRRRGRDAVLARHTYRHRAIEFAACMGLRLPDRRAAVAA